MIKFEGIKGNEIQFNDNSYIELKNFKYVKFRLDIMLENGELSVVEYNKIITILCEYYSKKEDIKKVESYLKRNKASFTIKTMQYNVNAIFIDINNNRDLISKIKNYVSKYNSLHYEYRCNYECLLIW